MKSTHKVCLAVWLLSWFSLLFSTANLCAQVLDAQKLLEAHTFWDNRDWDWYKTHLPFFECPDPDINTTYYYRWELLTKHLTYGSPNSGYSFTEFIDRPFWSGAYGAISCPAGLQLYEARWLREPRYAQDYAKYWFRTPGAQPRNYSTWLADALWAVHLVHPDEASIKNLLPDMIKNYEAWEKRYFVPEVGLFWQTGHDDGMEFNINSRQTNNILRGAPGYRPTINAYMWADAQAIARSAELAGDKALEEKYRSKAAGLKENLQKKLWDPKRAFFFPMSKQDEEANGFTVKALTLTYQSGQHAGSSYGRELIGYVPWQFNMLDGDKGYEVAWKKLLEADGFAATFGPSTVERNDPMFLLKKSCCWWSGQSWPYATSQTLTALANLLQNYDQKVITKADYLHLLTTFAKTHRKNGVPYLAEACHPDTGSFEGHDGYNHSEHYFHSSFNDLIITGLVGLKPRSDDIVEVQPLTPETWSYFALDRVPYHGRELAIVWDRDGKRYGLGAGLHLLVNGHKVATSAKLERLTAKLPPLEPVEKKQTNTVNFAVNNDGDYYPQVSASYAHAKTSVAKLIDGNYWYTLSPPNRWTCEGSANESDWLVVDFGTSRRLHTVKLYLLDDGTNIVTPSRFELEYWDGKAWTPVPKQTRSPQEPTGHRANWVRFPELETTKLRTVLTHAAKGRTGLTELEAWGDAVGPITPAPPPAGNLAFNPGGKPFPKASASFTSRFDKVEWANDGKVSFNPSPHNRWTSYESKNDSDWLEIDLGKPHKLARIELAIYDDRGGVQPPTSYTVQYWDGTAWLDAKEQKKKPELPQGGQINEVRFTPIETARIRVMFTHRGKARSGVSEIFVWGETAQPAPIEAPKPIEKPNEPQASLDWPAYKNDAARSGVTSAKISLPLAINWSHTSSQPPSPAWSEPGRSLNMMDFDYAFQPVSSSGLVYFGSSSDDTVRALDAKTGQLVWTFTTDGPVRFAPHIVKERCYFASDDGYVYCLTASTGKEVWRYRAALNDRRLLANGRMTSRWPCRSGVLVHEDVVYVTAGMWPSEGVYLHALDAKSGQPVWCNDTSCYDYVEYPHAPSTSFGGPAPQGYLLLGNKTLVVPTGRCAPAAFDAQTGKLLHFWANSPNRGGTWATLAHDSIFVSAVAWQPDQSVRLGESVPHRADSVAALNLRTGKEEWAWHKAIMEFTDELKQARWRSQVGGGIFSRQRVLFQGQRCYTLGNGKVDAFELKGDKTVKQLWSVPCPRVYSEALAANALFIGSQDKLLVLDPETGAKLDEIAVPGQVRGLALAEGRVIVSTERGQVLSLSHEAGTAPKRETAKSSAGKLGQEVQAHVDAVAGKGYALIAGSTDARLAQQLAENSQMHVLCLLPSQEIVLKERRRLLEETALHGSRLALVSYERSTKSLPFISFFANLVLIAGKDVSIASEELYRVLRPCGGRLLFLEGANGAAFVKEASVPSQEAHSKEGVNFIVRGKLPEAFDWDSKVEADQRVRWPLEFQWFGEPSAQLLVPRHARPRTSLPAFGRLFVFGESHITAIDAYNGTELWRRRLSVGVCTGQQVVSADDHFLYVQDGATTWQFEAHTGKLVKAYGKNISPIVHTLDKPVRLTSTGKQGESGTIALTHDPEAIEITLTTEAKTPSRDDRWELAFDFRSSIQRLNAPSQGAFELVLDPWKGTLVPHRSLPLPEMTLKALSVDKEGVSTIVLRFPRPALERWLGRKVTDFALAADVKLWTDDFRLRLWGRPLTSGARRTWPNEAEAIVVLSPESLRLVPFEVTETAPVIAQQPGRLPPMTRSRPDGDFSADFKDGLGKEANQGKATTLQRITGFELQKRLHPLTGEEVLRDYSRSYGCSGTSCSATMDFFRSGTIGMYDRFEDAGMRNISGIRSGCGQTILPAFGLLLYSESASDCLCSYSFATSLALAPAEAQRNEDWALFDDKQLAAGLIRRSALNLGAPGDRRDKDGTLWLGFPRPFLGEVKKTAWQLPYSLEIAPSFGPYRINTDRQPIESTRPWIYGSGVKGLLGLKMDLVHHQPSKVLLSLAPGQAPKVDGVLNDACWDGFGALPLADRDGKLFFRHDEQFLYVAYEQKTHIDRLGKTLPWKASVRDKDGNFDKDDHVRLSFFHPKGTKVLTFAVSAGGAKYDALLDLGKDGTLKDKRMPIVPEDASWDGTWQATTQHDDKSLRIEVALPWKTLTDAGLPREGLMLECLRKTRWGGAKDTSLLRLLESGVEIQSLEKPLQPRRFTVRLHFAELDDVKPGERVFDIVIQGKTERKDFDIVQEAKGRFRAVECEIRDVGADRQLEIRFVPKSKTLTTRSAPTLSAIEVLQQ